MSERMQPVPGPPGRHVGTWVGAGAINDAGTAAANFSIDEQGPDKGRVEGTHVLTSAQGIGTITLEFQAWLRPFPAPTPPRQVMVEGTWKLVAATGDYAGRQARGRLYGTADRTVQPPKVTNVFEGTAD
jgi:hypothetical protein